MIKKNKLYSFTTKIGKQNEEYKIGQTTYTENGKNDYENVIIYIKKQGTHRRERAVDIKYIGELPEGTRDVKIHKLLEHMGCVKIRNDGTEWFKCTPEQIENAYKILTKDLRQYNYSPRKEQEEAIDKAFKWFNSREHKREGNRFLLNAKMRFGKCFTGISLAKKLKAKRTLIVTFKTNVKDNWLKYPNHHKNFQDWKGITSLKDSIYDSLEEGFDISTCKNNLVLFVSMQDLSPDKEKHKGVFDTKWDLLIFDEIHYGGDAKQEKRNFDIAEERKSVEEKLQNKRLKYKYRVDMSGTPFRFKDRHGLQDDQIFTYTYLDEQENKKREVENNIEKKDRVYEHLPNIKLFTMDITKDQVNRQREAGTNEKDWSLNEMLKVEDEAQDFKYDAYVNDFLNDLISKVSTRNTNRKINRSVYGGLGDKCGLSSKMHAIWWIKGTNTANALERKLKKHSFFKDYKIINICGNQKGIEEYRFNNLLSEAEQNKQGSITITQGRLLTGSTLPKINSILVLNDCESVETYLQAIFRVQSPDLENGKILKQTGYIFDFSVRRAFRNIYTLSKNINETPNKEEGFDKIKPLIEAFNIKEVTFLEGKFQFEKPNIEDIISNYDSRKLAKKLNSRKRLVNQYWFLRLKDNPDLERILNSIRGYRNINSDKKDDLIDEKPSKKPSKKPDRSTSSKSPSDPNGNQEKEKRKNVGDQAVRLSVVLADFMYMTGKRENLVNHIINNQLRQKEFFKDVTGISVDEFKLLCDAQKGLLNKDELDNRVGEFRIEENSSVKVEKFVLDFINQDKKSS